MHEDLGRAATALIIPGMGDSGPGHWQTVWERERHDCERVVLGCWDDPNRNVWISRIDLAVSRADGPVVLVAHSLGCHAVLWWARLLGQEVPGNVVGALLVAPPDVDRSTIDPRVGRFGPTPRGVLPFPAILIASSDDPYTAPDRAEDLAASLGAEFVLVEGEGHLNAASGLGTWSEGQELLDHLLDASTRRQPRSVAALAHGASRSDVFRRL